MKTIPSASGSEQAGQCPPAPRRRRLPVPGATDADGEGQAAKGLTTIHTANGETTLFERRLTADDNYPVGNSSCR